MKPIRILVFFTAVFGLLFIIALVFPKDGIDLGNDLQIRFISSKDIFKKDSVQGSYTDSLIQHAVVSDDPEFGEVDSLFFVNDSSTIEVHAVNMDSLIRARIDSISRRVHPMEYTDQGKLDLYQFFKAANQSQKNGKLIRILHFGDSQIENDRMTSLLRYRFQKIFGGSGCGVVPAIPLYFGNPTFRESFEGNWQRYTVFGKRDSTLAHDCFGMLGCFTEVPLPTKEQNPSLHFKFHEGRRASKFSSVNLYLHAYSDSGYLDIKVNDTIAERIDSIKEGYNIYSYKPKVQAENIDLEFFLPNGGRIYGIGFDASSGIQVDNIAMRGSSGLEFSKSDRQTLDTMIHGLNPGLILMQFGGNVVPYIENASFYKRTFKRELNYLKELFPGVAILVIGPSDMSTKENGRFATYPSLVPVRNALREASLETDCLFWDMYTAMGGENSMQNFVLADPPLARPDYIHFTPKGANMMAGMFFDALALEYGRYSAEGK